MKLATIVHLGRPTVSIVDVDGDLYWPLSEAVPGLPERLAHDMVATIAHFGSVAAAAAPASAGFALAGARVLAPIPTPPHNNHVRRQELPRPCA